MQAADSGHPDSPDVPEVVDTVVGLVGPPPIDTHLGGPPQHEGGPPNGLDPLGPLPPNWEKAYTDKGESYFIGKSLISILSQFFLSFHLIGDQPKRTEVLCRRSLVFHRSQYRYFPSVIL